MVSILALLLSLVCIWFVGKSIILQLFENPKESSPEGIQAVGKKWLIDNGYELLKTDNEASFTGYLDDSSIRYNERVHFIARKNAKEYAVFVGLESPTQAEICQKYFPVYTILGVDELIFINLTDESVHHLDFYVHRPKRVRMKYMLHRGMWFTGGVFITFAFLHRM